MMNIFPVFAWKPHLQHLSPVFNFFISATLELNSSLRFSILICFSLTSFYNFRLSCFRSCKISFFSPMNFSTFVLFFSIVIFRLKYLLLALKPFYPSLQIPPSSKDNFLLHSYFYDCINKLFLFETCIDPHTSMLWDVYKGIFYLYKYFWNKHQNSVDTYTTLLSKSAVAKIIVIALKFISILNPFFCELYYINHHHRISQKESGFCFLSNSRLSLQTRS